MITEATAIVENWEALKPLVGVLLAFVLIGVFCAVALQRAGRNK